MRKKLLVNSIVTFITIVLSLSLSAQEQQYTAAEDLTLPKMVLLHGKIVTPILTSPKNTVPEHLQEFGLYRTGLYADDEDISAVATFATFVDVKHNNIEQMQIASACGLKLWVDIRRVFFTKVSDKYTKRPDYWESWLAAKENLKPFKDIIYAFDPLDEPFFNSDMSDLTDYLEEISSLLEVEFPNARRALTFTEKTVRSSRFHLLLPDNYDLLGVDHYVGEDFSSGVVLDLMEKTKYSGAKYYLIPQAFQTDDGHYAILSQEQLINKARQAYNFAISHPKVEVLRPHQWDSFEYNQHFFIGVEDLPKLRKEYEKIGSAISNFR